MDRQVLTRARDLIAKAPELNRGFFVVGAHTGDVINGDVKADGLCFCTAGAVMAAAHDWLIMPLLKPLARAIESDSQDFEQTVYEWNDAPGRTKQDVLDLFDKVLAS